MKGEIFWKFVLVVSLWCVFLPSVAIALNIGNPAVRTEIGTFYVGASVSENSRDFDITFNVSTDVVGSGSASGSGKLDITRQYFLVGFSIGENSAAEISFGKLILEDEDGGELEGNEYGFLFTHQGFIASMTVATVENIWWEGNFTQVNFGYMFSKDLENNLRLFGGPLFSKVSSELNATQLNLDDGSAYYSWWFGFPVVVTSATLEFEEDSVIGGILGLNINPSESMSVSFEVHALFETGFGLSFLAGF